MHVHFLPELFAIRIKQSTVGNPTAMNPDPPPPVPPSIPPIPPAADPPLVSAGESAKDNAEKALGMAREGLMGGVATY